MTDNTDTSNGADKAEDLQPTPPEEWAALRAVREHGVLQMLPSGNVVQMRNVTPESLLRMEKIPDILATLALRTLYGQRGETELLDFTQPREDPKEAVDVMESARIVCTASLVYPRIVEEPEGEDEIHFDDLPAGDRSWIFMLALQEADILRSFRFTPLEELEEGLEGEIEEAAEDGQDPAQEAEK